MAGQSSDSNLSVFTNFYFYTLAFKLLITWLLGDVLLFNCIFYNFILTLTLLSNSRSFYFLPLLVFPLVSPPWCVCVWLSSLSAQYLSPSFHLSCTISSVHFVCLRTSLVFYIYLFSSQSTCVWDQIPAWCIAVTHQKNKCYSNF